MMDWTDRHCRAFHRALTSKALLYTEMVTAPAVLHGDRERLLGFDALEHPVALQLGRLAQRAKDPQTWRDVVWLFLFVTVYVWGGWGAPVHGG